MLPLHALLGFGMGRQLGLPVFLLTLTVTPVVALDCKSDALTQAELNQCAGEAYQAADAGLNRRFGKITACLKEKAQMLVEAQRAWIKFRDAECKFQSTGSEGGTVQSMLDMNCLRGLTEERSKGLDYYLTCEEGDPSCVTVACSFKAETPRSP